MASEFRGFIDGSKFLSKLTDKGCEKSWILLRITVLQEVVLELL